MVTRKSNNSPRHGRQIVNTLRAVDNVAVEILSVKDLTLSIMNILFIHQNFPGQFKFLAPVPALAAQGHDVMAFTMQKNYPTEWQGVRMVHYQPGRGTTPNAHPWVSDFETKTIRGEAAGSLKCWHKALRQDKICRNLHYLKG